MKFSPDGTHLAVGFNSGAGNEVLGVSDLETISGYFWSEDQRAGMSFARVAWAPDGLTILSSAVGANTGLNGRRWFSIFEWPLDPDAPDAKSGAVFTGIGSLLNFVALPSAETARSIGVGLWNGAIFRAQGGALLWQSPAIKNLFDEGHSRSLLVSDDGASVAFEAATPAHSFRIDLLAGQLAPGDRIEGLSRSLLSSPLLKVEVPQGDSGILINGNRPALDRWESASAWAVERGGASIILATRFKIRRIAGDGSEVWAADPGPETWLVNVTGDGQYVVVAMGDGTIRWFDYRTGQQRLSVFVHADLRRWIAWTGDGHFTGRRESWDLLRAYRDGGPTLGWPEPMEQSAFAQALYAPDLLTRMFARAR